MTAEEGDHLVKSFPTPFQWDSRDNVLVDVILKEAKVGDKLVWEGLTGMVDNVNTFGMVAKNIVNQYDNWLFYNLLCILNENLNQ